MAAPPSIQFRRMRRSDLDAVMVVNHQSFAHPWSADLIRRELLHDWSTILLAVEQGAEGEALLGFIVFWLIHDEVHVLNVAVAREHRRRGIARALMQEAAERGRARRARLVTLEVRAGNAPAIALYRQLGYRDVAIRPRYYAEENEDALVMELAL